MTNVRQKADIEKQERDNMVRQREEMLCQLQEMEGQEEKAKDNTQQIHALHEVRRR